MLLPSNPPSHRPPPNLIKEPGHFVIRNSSIVGAWSLTIRNPEGAPKKCHHTLINSSATPSGMVFQLQKSSRKCDVFPSLSGPLLPSSPPSPSHTRVQYATLQTCVASRIFTLRFGGYICHLRSVSHSVSSFCSMLTLF